MTEVAEEMTNVVEVLERMHKNDRALLRILIEKKKISVKEAAELLKINKDAIMRSGYTLKENNFVDIKKEEIEGYSLTKEGIEFLENYFPEQMVVKKAEENGKINVKDLTDIERNVGVPWAVKNFWIKIKTGRVFIDGSPDYKKYNLHQALKKIKEGEKVGEKELEKVEKVEKIEKIDPKIIKSLYQRGSIEKKVSKSFLISITDKGTESSKVLEDIEKKARKEGVKEIGILTPEVIASGEWKDAKFTKYNIKAPAEKPEQGRIHPLSVFIQKVRRIFLNMGFEEISGPEIESSFWNFDALFQPQDHPARELHDTFYLKKPGYLPYPSDIAEKVKEAHEKNWRYNWDPDIAEKPILRTHTTAVSARTLAEVGKGTKEPGKYFCAGKVYRNEATDYKHLAEFQMVEGIVVWENATFCDLLGCLKEFYKQLGFEKIKFVPHYFPYTEPSLEINVYYEKKKEWIEFGGAGIFRPEVSLPLWGKYPVLAWGLSIERALMVLMNLEDIRTFYKNDLNWLRKARI